MQDSQAAPEAVQQLNLINGLQSEIRELRNQLEEQQFELENMKLRQQDLFQGLDQRLRVAENSQHNGTMVLPPNTSSEGLGGHVQQPYVAHPPVNPPQGAVVGSDNPTQTLNEAQGVTPETLDTGSDQQLLYDQGFDYLKLSRYTEAITTFTQLADQFPSGGLADDAIYWVGEANFVNRQYEAAIIAFRKVVAQYPASDRVPEALLKVGYVQYDIGDYNEAKVTFNDVLRRYKDHPVSISAQSRLDRIERGLSN